MSVPRAKQSTFVDAFFTAEHAVEACAAELRKWVSEDCFFVDFSAGTNAFAHRLGLPHLSFDLHVYPETCGKVVQRDWLTVTELPGSERHAELCIGFNPPYGHRYMLMHDFVRRAASFEPEWMCLLCPASYKLKVAEHRLYEEVSSVALPAQSFHFAGSKQPFSFPCRFAVWRRRQVPLAPTDRRGPEVDSRFRLTRVVGSLQVPKDERTILVRVKGNLAGKSYFETHADGSLTEYRLTEKLRDVSSWQATGIASTRYEAIALLDPTIDRRLLREKLPTEWEVERPDAFAAGHSKFNFSLGRVVLTRMLKRCLL